MGAMLDISQTTLDALTRRHMMDKLLVFLRKHSPDPALQGLLVDADRCFSFWTPWMDDIDRVDEQHMAVRLSYLLACRARGEQPRLVEAALEDAEVAMKTRLEQWAILPFGAFEA